MAEVEAIAADQLRSFIERIERLEEEKAALTADIREVYAEAKARGFDAKIMRQVVRLRKLEQADRREQEELLDLYLGALDRALERIGAAETSMGAPVAIRIEQV